MDTRARPGSPVQECKYILQAHQACFKQHNARSQSSPALSAARHPETRLLRRSAAGPSLHTLLHTSEAHAASHTTLAQPLQKSWSKASPHCAGTAAHISSSQSQLPACQPRLTCRLRFRAKAARAAAAPPGRAPCRTAPPARPAVAWHCSWFSEGALLRPKLQPPSGAGRAWPPVQQAAAALPRPPPAGIAVGRRCITTAGRGSSAHGPSFTQARFPAVCGSQA